MAAGQKPDARVNPAPAHEAGALDRVFSALADPVRREILARLEGGELLVSELARPFNISLQAVSRHIQVLVRAGLVAQERSGRISRCRLDAGPIYQAALWLNRYSKYWQAQFDTLAAWVGRIDRERAPSAAATRRRRGERKARPGRRKSNSIKGG